MSKMISEMEELSKYYLTEGGPISSAAVDACIIIAKKHKKKKKGKCEWHSKEVYCFSPHKFEYGTICCLTKDIGIKYKKCPYCGKKIKIKESE